MKIMRDEIHGSEKEREEGPPRKKKKKGKKTRSRSTWVWLSTQSANISFLSSLRTAEFADDLRRERMERKKKRRKEKRLIGNMTTGSFAKHDRMIAGGAHKE